MADQKTKKPAYTKNAAKEQVTKALNASLGELKKALGEKKFERRIKKATRLLIDGLPKAPKPKKVKAKKIVLKSTDKNDSIGTTTDARLHS